MHRLRLKSRSPSKLLTIDENGVGNSAKIVRLSQSKCSASRFRFNNCHNAPSFSDDDGSCYDGDGNVAEDASMVEDMKNKTVVNYKHIKKGGKAVIPPAPEEKRPGARH